MRGWLFVLGIGIAAAQALAQGAPEPEASAEPAPSTEAAPAAEPAAVREAVEAGNYFFTRYFAERDAEALAELYTEDARVLAPGAAPVAGRAAIAEFWARAMQDTASVRLETLAVEADGALAYEEGVVHLVANDGRQSSARYVVVWKRVGRRWHLHRDVWNAGPPAEPAASVAPGPPAPAPAEPTPPAPAEAPAPAEPAPGPAPGAP